MKNIKLTLALIAISIAFTSCKDVKQEKARKALNAYTKYVDSVSNIEEQKAVANWEAIDNMHSKLKMEAENSIENTTDKTKLQAELDESESKYEGIKTNILTAQEKTEENTANTTDDAKTTLYKALFGSSYMNDDMKFNWVNKDNILSVYDNFVTTVDKNKGSYSHEDWNEIKMAYDALNSRKNTVEKEGLTSHDNNKIATLKLKFDPIYAANKMGPK